MVLTEVDHTGTILGKMQGFFKASNGRRIGYDFGCAFLSTDFLLLRLSRGIKTGKGTSTLRNDYPPFVNENHINGYVFMQEEVPCLRANLTKAWFQRDNVKVLELLAYSST